MIAGQPDWRAVTGGWIYLIARAVYLPLYAKGTPKVRSLVWVASILGILLVGWGAVQP
jgi:uncharacterized MAPEG superfamily protein